MRTTEVLSQKFSPDTAGINPRKDPLRVRKTLTQRGNGQVIIAAEPERPGETSLAQHVFTLTGEQTLRFNITPNTESIFGAKPLDRKTLTHIRRTLTARQQPYIPEIAEAEHLNTILFLSRNWERIRDILYPFETSGNTPPVSFAEVVLDQANQHRADFIGLGPDGRAFIIEVGKRSKSSQVQGYVELFRNLFDDSVSATPLVAYYSLDHTGKNIHVKPPYMPDFGTSDRALEFIQEIAARGSAAK